MIILDTLHSLHSPIPRGPKKAKTTEEKDAVTADAPAASAEVNTNPAGEKEAALEESKAEEPAPVADEQVTKVAEEVPDKAQEAAAQATPDVAVETKGAVSSGAVEVGSMIPLDVTLKTDEDKEVSVKDLVAEKGYVESYGLQSTLLIRSVLLLTERCSSYTLKPILRVALLKLAASV